MVGLRKLLPPVGRKPKPRPDAPKTIVPPKEPAQRFDAARDRLRSQIPPRSDDSGA